MSNLDIEDFIKMHLPDDEEMKQLRIKSYNYSISNKNNFSYWYPRIISTSFKMANIVYNKVFSIEERDIIEKDYNEVDFKQIRDMLSPVIESMNPTKVYSIKNGTFSNKFNFNSSLATRDNLERKFYEVNYMAACVGAEGGTEIVVRELIDSDDSLTPTIYYGLPLRPEFRVFYDMDNKEVLYTVNYWDYDYCRPNITNRTDQIVFDYYKDYLDSKFNEYKDIVEKLVKNSEFDLTGKWSVDIMLDDVIGDLYLIDMAEADRSAYYDPERCKDII